MQNKDKNNSQRFLDAYNRVDSALHSRFGFKPSMSFTDAVRRAAALNSIVRRYEDDLVGMGRLRNAIVHMSDSTRAIAEPHDDVTAELEHIAFVLSEPPRASKLTHTAKTVTPTTALSDAVKVMNERGFSVMPVVDRRAIVGALTNKDVTRFVAEHIGGVDSALSTATVGDALSDSNAYYDVMPDVPIDDVLQAFERNRKLRMVIIVADGKPDGNIIGVITTGDLVAISKLLDTY